MQKNGQIRNLLFSCRKARKDLNAYSFLFWIDQYLKPRRTKSNVKDINLDVSADEEENSEAAENTPSFQEFDDQPFDEEQIPDATKERKLALQTEKEPKMPPLKRGICQY